MHQPLNIRNIFLVSNNLIPKLLGAYFYLPLSSPQRTCLWRQLTSHVHGLASSICHNFQYFSPTSKMRTTLPAASIASLLSSSTFSINILNVRQVVASGGLTTEHFSRRMAARKLRPGKECSFVNKENADKFEKNEVDSDILKEFPEVEACVKDATSSLGGRCVASTMASASQVIMLTSGSCAGNCGIFIDDHCFCDDECLGFGDCCRLLQCV